MKIESLDDLKRVHCELLKADSWKREHAPGFWDCVCEFLDAGTALGARLWASEDRRSAQSLLDYWATGLYRARRITHKALLLHFDENTPGAFVPIKRAELPRVANSWGVSVELWPGNMLKVRSGAVVCMYASQIPDLIRALGELQ